MKTLNFLCVLFFISKSALGQGNSNDSIAAANQLKGIWYVVNSWPSVKDTLVFARQSKAPYNWGDRIEISEKGEIIDAYSAKCGNDDRIHSTTGNWILNKNGDIITTTIPIYLDRTKNKILILTPDTLVLLRLQ